jgi:hypothetical protein
MLIDDEGEVKPASTESRLVMIQLEPKLEVEVSGEERNQARGEEKRKKKKQKRKRKRRHPRQQATFVPVMEACCGREGPHGSLHA